jgi:hypothetical protein
LPQRHDEADETYFTQLFEGFYTSNRQSPKSDVISAQTKIKIAVLMVKYGRSIHTGYFLEEYHNAAIIKNLGLIVTNIRF